LLIVRCALLIVRFGPQEQVRRMLRLSEEDERAVQEFQAMHAAAREAGFGRIFRSPTLFEDMVKCMLLCNCQLSLDLHYLSIPQFMCGCGDVRWLGSFSLTRRQCWDPYCVW
jgi:hypothetical protein